MDEELLPLMDGRPGWKVVYRRPEAPLALKILLPATFIFLAWRLWVFFSGLPEGIRSMGRMGRQMQSQTSAAEFQVLLAFGAVLGVAVVLLFVLDLKILGSFGFNLAKALLDRFSKTEAFRGEVMSLRPFGGRRRSMLGQFRAGDRDFRVPMPVLKTLRVGQPVIVQFKPHSPTLLSLLVLDES